MMISNNADNSTKEKQVNWEAIGAIAEIVGATAVLATLIYLALQISQNSRLIGQQNDMARAQTIQLRADSVAPLVFRFYRSKEYLTLPGLISHICFSGDWLTQWPYSDKSKGKA